MITRRNRQIAVVALLTASLGVLASVHLADQIGAQAAAEVPSRYLPADVSLTPTPLTATDIPRVTPLDLNSMYRTVSG